MDFSGFRVMQVEEEIVELDPTIRRSHLLKRPSAADRHRSMRSAPTPAPSSPLTPFPPLASSHRELPTRRGLDLDNGNGLRRTYRQMTKEEFKAAAESAMADPGFASGRARANAASSDKEKPSAGRHDRADERRSAKDSSTNAAPADGASASASRARKLEEKKGNADERRSRATDEKRSRATDERRSRAPDRRAKTDDRRSRTTQEKDTVSDDRRARSDHKSRARLEDRKVGAGGSRRPGQRISASSGWNAGKEKSRGIH